MDMDEGDPYERELQQAFEWHRRRAQEIAKELKQRRTPPPKRPARERAEQIWNRAKDFGGAGIALAAASLVAVRHWARDHHTQLAASAGVGAGALALLTASIATYEREPDREPAVAAPPGQQSTIVGVPLEPVDDGAEEEDAADEPAAQQPTETVSTQAGPPAPSILPSPEPPATEPKPQQVATSDPEPPTEPKPEPEPEPEPPAEEPPEEPEEPEGVEECVQGITEVDPGPCIDLVVGLLD